MAASTSHFSVPVIGTQEILSTTTKARTRRISPEAGRALELLGHAIEYLADEYVDQGKTFTAGDPQVEAIQILMELNRQIYFSCPLVPSFTSRFLNLFGLPQHDL